jgi:small-conductance mechanosensitive channel
MALSAIDINKFLVSEIAGNSGKDYVIAFGIFLGLIAVLWIFELYILTKLKKLAKKTKTQMDDIILEFISEIHWRLYIFISVYIASKSIVLHPVVSRTLHYLIIIVVVYYGVKFVLKIIDYFTHRQIKIRLEEDKTDDTTFISVLGRMVKAIIWVIAIMLILSNFGVNITSLIAGLGIGGIAIAFALQNILEDLFSSFSIYFDKPFKKGDFIIIGPDMGVVKYIGIKSTRIQTLQGQELVVSNKELTNTRVNNYKRMEKRRIVFAFGVEYDTSLKKLKDINQIVKGVFKNIKLVKLDRVHFKDFGNFSLNYEVVYYLDSSDYNKYMDTQQEINFSIKNEFEKSGIAMAFPTQTLYVKK